MPTLMTQAEIVRLTAEGMIRNFGDRAAEEAEAIATRHGRTSTEGKALWLAVAREIRAIQRR